MVQVAPMTPYLPIDLDTVIFASDTRPVTKTLESTVRVMPLHIILLIAMCLLAQAPAAQGPIKATLPPTNAPVWTKGIQPIKHEVGRAVRAKQEPPTPS